MKQSIIIFIVVLCGLKAKAFEKAAKGPVIRYNTENEELTVRFISAAIPADNIEEAINEYIRLTNGARFISIIAEKAYHRNVNNFGLCLMFGEKLPTQYEQFKFWQYLYFEMLFSNDLHTVRNFDLLQKLDGIDENALNELDKNVLSTMKITLRLIINEALQKLTEIDLNNYYQYYSRYTNVLVENDTRIYEFVNDFIAEMYNITSGNYFHVQMYNERAFGHLNLKGIGIKIIYEMLKNTSNLENAATLKLASTVKSVIDSPEFLVADSQTKTLYIKLMNDFPPLVRLLFWEDVCIKNAHLNKTLFADDNPKFMETSDHPVFGWNSTKQPKNGVWKFETYDNGDTFLIKNVQLNEYVYASSSLVNGTCSTRGSADAKKLYTKKIYSSAAVLKDKYKFKLFLINKASKIRIESKLYSNENIATSFSCAIEDQRLVMYVNSENDANYIELW